MPYKTKESFLEHLMDAKYTFLLVFFIIINYFLLKITKENDLNGLNSFLYQVFFIGIATILTLAYFKRNYEVEQNISEPIRWSILSVSLVSYISLLCLSQFILYKDLNLLDNVYSYFDNDGLTTFLLMLPVVILILLLYFKRRSEELNISSKGKNPNFIDIILKTVSTIFFICLPIFIIYCVLFATEFEKDYPYTAILLTITMGFIFIAIGMLIFKTFKKNIQDFFGANKINTGHNELTFINLIKYSLFYIPCLITQFVDFLKHEYSITTKSSIYTLLVTSLLILFYLILPSLKKKLYNFGSYQLLEGPIYLNKYTKLGSFESLDSDNQDGYSGELNLSKYKLKLDYNNNKHVDLINTNIYEDQDYKDNEAMIDSSGNVIYKNNYTYCLSFWVNINPQPPNTSPAYNDYVSIFNYGKKPEVLYKASNNHLLIKMIQGKDGEDIIYKSDDVSEFKLQKWNHFCINYDKGTLDIFLNNKLIASKPGIVPYVTSDVISCGSAGGIEGGICNVRYYNRVLSQSQIYSEYESFKNKNPPII